MGKLWTKQEIEYLEAEWGAPTSIPYIAKKLGRSNNAVIIRARRMGLGGKREAGDWVLLRHLLLGLGLSGRQTGSLIVKRGLPYKTILIAKRRVRITYLDAFWKWAEKNKSFFDFSKFEPYAIGPEPDWAKEKRREDQRGRMLIKNGRWTSSEEAWLREYVRQKKTCPEIAQALRRSEAAVIRRCWTLKINRPARQPAHQAHWTKEQYLLLKDYIVAGKPWVLISREIGKSEKSCRGRAFAIWGTEVQDRIRQRIPACEQKFLSLLNGRGRSEGNEKAV